MGDPARMGMRAELHNFMVDLAELNKAQAVLLKRLVVLSKFRHVKCELIVGCLDLLGS